MTFDMWLVSGLFVIALIVALGFPVSRAILTVTFRHPRERTRIKVGRGETRIENESVGDQAQYH